MPALTPIQTPGATALTSGGGTFTINGVTAGSTLVGCIAIDSSSTRSWTITDNIDAGSWSTAKWFTPGRSMHIGYRTGVTGGNYTVTFTIDSGAPTGLMWVIELPPSTFTVEGSLNENPTSGTSHTCNATNLTGTDACAVAIGCVTSSTGAGLSPGGSYIEATGATSTSLMFMYNAQASLNDNGPWTSGASRVGQSCMAVFESTGGSSANRVLVGRSSALTRSILTRGLVR